MGALKPSLIIVVALCSVTIACHKEDTGKRDVWPRTVEPRLSDSNWQPCRSVLTAGHAVPEAACGPKTTSLLDCGDVITSEAQAVRLLASQEHCADAAIAALENLGRGAKSDLAAAYYVRAQLQDRPSDLLRAFDAASQAITASPQAPAALFNYALIVEALGLSEEAAASWKAFLAIDHSKWAPEARAHLDRLERERKSDAPAQWERNRPLLASVTPAEAARLIAPMQATAERYLEDEVLPRWAKTPSPQNLKEATTIATAFWQLTGDRFTLDIIDSITRSPVEVQQGLLARAGAGNKDGYDHAASLLERAGCPLALLTRVDYANLISFEPGGNARAQVLLMPVEREARKHQYTHLMARLHATRANSLSFEGRFTESLTESDAAIRDYQLLHDDESVADARMRRFGVVDKSGQHELAMRDAMRAARDLPRLIEPRARYLSRAGSSDVALSLGDAPVALLYLNDPFHELQRALVAIPPEQLPRIKKLQIGMASLLRSRALVEVQLAQYDQAKTDLDEAIRLAEAEELDPAVRRVMGAPRAEVRGQVLLRSNPERAVTAFTEALAMAGTEFPTYRASLLAQRAEARRLTGHNAEAEKDLQESIAVLRAEQLRILERRERGQDEELWSAYFSRFPQTYEHLIRQLIREGRNAEAFNYAESERAFEPLNLISKELALNPADLAQIQRSLPPGTLLIEYSVFDDQTVAWLIAHDQFIVVPLRARRSVIARRSAALQAAARAYDATGFETQLFALYDELIAVPLDRFKTMPARLVIVPDGPMHGLPFAALHNPKTNHYLIQDVPVEISGSANLYLASLRRDSELASSGDRSVLLIGDPAFDDKLDLARGFKPLPHARHECRRINALYAPHARMRLESDATIPQFLSLARGSAVVHIAAHGIVNAQTPSRSFILLAPSPNEPGPLDAQMLLTRLHLDHTRLVVLSTCSSAGGLPVGAEGVAPLVRPLIGAGVPAVIGSLWDIDDATVEDLLVSFHRRYQEGNDAAIALQRAQRDQLLNKKPVFAWAAFQVIGHGSSPFAPAPQHKEKPP
jgi:CHAT domain-containing protein